MLYIIRELVNQRRKDETDGVVVTVTGEVIDYWYLPSARKGANPKLSRGARLRDQAFFSAAVLAACVAANLLGNSPCSLCGDGLVGVVSGAPMLPVWLGPAFFWGGLLGLSGQ